MDRLIDSSRATLAKCEEIEARSEERELQRQERAKQMQVAFEDRVALGKNTLNLDLDERITRLRQEYAAIEGRMASTSSSSSSSLPAVT